MEIDGRQSARPKRLGVRGRMQNPYLACAHLWYSPRSERGHLKVPRNGQEHTTLLASMGVERMGPCLAVEASTTAEVFEAYLWSTPSLPG